MIMCPSVIVIMCSTYIIVIICSMYIIVIMCSIISNFLF